MIGLKVFLTGLALFIPTLLLGVIMYDKTKPQTGLLASFTLAFLVEGLMIVGGLIAAIWSIP